MPTPGKPSRSWRTVRLASLLVGVAAIRGSPAAAEAGATVSEPAPAVVAERPYRPGGRPRPQGAVQASVDDEDVARWNVGGNGDPNFRSNHADFHPAPRILVDLALRSGSLPKRGHSKGTLTEAGLVAQARNAGYWPFRLCFEDGLRRDQALRGKTRVRLTVDVNGRVKSEKIGFTELRDHSVAKCLASRIHSMHFSPAPPRRLHADITVDLNPGDAPIPDPDPPAAPADVPGAATSKVDDVDGTEPLRRVTGCFAEGLARDPKLWGRIAILLELDADGRVREAAEHDSHFPDPAVSACALDALRGASVTKPQGGATRLIWAVRLGTPPPSGAGLAALRGGPSPR